MRDKINYDRLQLLQEDMKRRLAAQNHSDLMSFYRSAGLRDVMSFESLRRCINDTDKTVSVLTVALIMSRLGYKNPEIRATMKELGDRYYFTLVSDSEEKLSLPEEGLLTAYQKLIAANPAYLKAIHDTMAALATVGGVNIGEELARMVPTGRTYKRSEADVEVEADKPAVAKKRNPRPIRTDGFKAD